MGRSWAQIRATAESEGRKPTTAEILECQDELAEMFDALKVMAILGGRLLKVAAAGEGSSAPPDGATDPGGEGGTG
jgi:hypothetical protein